MTPIFSDFMLVSEVPAFRDYWYPVAYTHEVGAEPFAVRLFGERYVFWRPEADAPALGAVDRCRHRAARLTQGWVADGCLVCPYHGWRYDVSGRCVQMPALGPDAAITSRARLDTVATGERYGLVWACVGEPVHPIPVLEELESGGYTLIHELKQEWRASAPRMIDNALDVSHVSFVHRGTVGDPAHPRMSDFDVVRDGHRIRFSVSYKSAVSGTQASNVGLQGIVNRTTHAELVDPFVFRGVLEYDNGLRHVLFKTCSPIDDGHTLFFQFIGRNDHPTPDRWDDISAVDRAVQAEDRALLEEIEADYPIDLVSEVHTRADRMTIEYRRILADIAGDAPTVAE